MSSSEEAHLENSLSVRDKAFAEACEFLNQMKSSVISGATAIGEYVSLNIAPTWNERTNRIDIAITCAALDYWIDDWAGFPVRVKVLSEKPGAAVRGWTTLNKSGQGRICGLPRGIYQFEASASFVVSGLRQLRRKLAARTSVDESTAPIAGLQGDKVQWKEHWNARRKEMGVSIWTCEPAFESARVVLAYVTDSGLEEDSAELVLVRQESVWGVDWIAKLKRDQDSWLRFLIFPK